MDLSFLLFCPVLFNFYPYYNTKKQKRKGLCVNFYQESVERLLRRASDGQEAAEIAPFHGKESENGTFEGL